MFAKDLPEAWQIEELEPLRRGPETEVAIPLPLPLPMPSRPAPSRRESHDERSGSTVVVIDLW